MPHDNILLASLPDATLANLRPHLELVAWAKGSALYEPGDVVRYAYFPTSGLASWLVLTAGGSMLELAAIGHEGVVGLPILLQGETTPHTLVVQVPGAAFRIRADRLHAEVQRNPILRTTLLRYADRVVSEIAQAALCHHFHTILQRLCRWLLTAADRLHTDAFALTQDELALLLGVPRTSISRAVVELQDAGTIRVRHGSLVLVNRRRLELSACECYRAPSPD